VQHTQFLFLVSLFVIFLIVCVVALTVVWVVKMIYEHEKLHKGWQSTEGTTTDIELGRARQKNSSSKIVRLDKSPLKAAS
jgi:hypothetical protein